MAKGLALVLVVFLVLGAIGKAHVQVSGPSPSVVTVVNPPSNSSRTLFEMVVVLDDPLTE
uniref:Uncharacterized protein n=1 Tax=Oryza brachyantha TaxID=4533 RepID=J3N6G6_ORYBR